MRLIWLVFATVTTLSLSCSPAQHASQGAAQGAARVNHYGSMAQVSPDGKGAVASVNSIATQSGVQAFERGGNAIDALAATAFTLGVVDSPNSGIGGGCFILVRWADGSIEAIDGREMAPDAAFPDMYLVNGEYNSQLSKTGALAIGVPGSVAALEYLVKKGGKLGWREAIQPAAEIAESGFMVDKVYSTRLARSRSRLELFPESRRVFFPENGEPVAEGSIFRQADLAKTYRKLAEQGSDYFYRGEFAQKVEGWMKANGGIITAADFSGYELKNREPVVSTFQGYKIIGFPPPSSGGAHVAQILNILDLYPLKSVPAAQRYHLEIEAMKRAFADRAFWMGDADFVDVPKGIIEPEYAKTLAASIDRDKATTVGSHGTPPDAATHLFNRHTTHIAVADKAGNWIAMTTTLNTGFGSKVTIPGTGVLMNNQMDDFSAQPGKANAFGLVGGHANQIEPGKRPLSSMSPTIVLKDDEPVMTVGAAGGPTIINQVVAALVNRLALGQSAPDSLSTARVHQQWSPETVLVDSYLDDAVRRDLEARGHQLVDWPSFGATQLIVKEGAELKPVSEPRLVERLSGQ